MKKVQLSGSVRASVGKKDSNAVRNADRVPCVLYGLGEQTHFSVRAVDVQKIIFSPDVYQVQLDIDGKKANAIIKAKQMHPVRDTAMHVDFLELSDTKKVKLSLPLRTTGAAIGIMNGGKLRQPYRMLRIIGLPGEIPESITVDISNLKIGHSIKVSDLDSKGIEFLEPANAVVLGIKMARGASEEELAEEEAAAEEAAAEAATEGEGEAAAEATETAEATAE